MSTVYTRFEAPVGEVLLVGESHICGTVALTGAYLVGQRYEKPVGADWVRDDAAFADAAEQFREYFAGERTAFELTIAPSGSTFQRAVWHALESIPYGTTCTYGHIAEQVADRRATRAVAAAIGRNPLSIVVPCHRVVGANGALTGYAGGLERKRWLLDLEAGVANPAPDQLALS